MNICGDESIFIPITECDDCEEFLSRLENVEKNKQDKLIAGDGIHISDENVISSDFDMTDYYTKEEIDEIIRNLMRGNPEILGLTEIIMEEGDSLDDYDFMDGVTAFDHEGDDITANVVVTGTVDPDTPGEYTLTYSVTDDHGKTTTETRKVVVEEWNINNYATVLFADGHFMINEKKANRDADIAVHGAVTNEYAPGPYSFTNNTSQPWNSQKASILSAEFGSNYKPTSCAFLFQGLNNCTSIDLSKLDTSETTTMQGMFNNCRTLTALDVSNFNTSEVTFMTGVFFYCSALSSLDVSNFDTSKVTNMTNMFSYCSALTSLDVSNFNTSNVTNMSQMFNSCQSLNSLDVSNFNTSNVTNMANMFSGCQSLNSLDVSNFNTSNVTNMGQMFGGCQSLNSLDVSNFNTSNVTDMQYMFISCLSLRTIFASTAFNTTAVTKFTDMFRNCTSLIGGAGTPYNSSKTNKEYARIDNPPSEPGYFTAKP